MKIGASKRRYFQSASVFKFSKFIFSMVPLVVVWLWAVSWCWGSVSSSRRIFIEFLAWRQIRVLTSTSSLPTEINQVFNFPSAHARPPQRWRSLLCDWFVTPIWARRWRRSPLTPSLLPLIEHMRCNATDYFTMCWLKVSDCLRCRCVHFNDCVWRRAYPNVGVSRLILDEGVRWTPFLNHSIDKQYCRSWLIPVEEGELGGLRFCWQTGASRLWVESEALKPHGLIYQARSIGVFRRQVQVLVAVLQAQMISVVLSIGDHRVSLLILLIRANR